MLQAYELNKVPEYSIISKFFGKVDYVDSFQIEKKGKESVDEIVSQLFRMPQWLSFLFKIRNSIVRRLGLKVGKTKIEQVSTFYPIGSDALLFRVLDRNNNEIVLGENDVHLDFRTSVLIDNAETYAYIYITTIVKFNSIFGRIYFMPVKPVHRLIIKSTLKRLLA